MGFVIDLVEGGFFADRVEVDVEAYGYEEERVEGEQFGGERVVIGRHGKWFGGCKYLVLILTCY